ncbi:polymeric immunoglobulin receptor-like isoform 2-T2 [Menidia menidia]
MKEWSSLKLLLICYTALGCVGCAAAVIQVFGYEGTDVQVSCPYDEGYEDYEKYLCKNNCGSRDVLITTSESNKTKYSISDDTKRRTVTVTISDVRSADAGKYWCAVRRRIKDYFTEVKLQLRRDSCCEEVRTVQSYEEGSVSIVCRYESRPLEQKYLCKGSRPSTCRQQALVTSDRTPAGRFTLTDDRTSRFTVNISGLTAEDSGRYLCGVRRNSGLDDFSAVRLEVRGWCCSRLENFTGTVGRPLTLHCPYPAQHRTNRKFLCKGETRKGCRDVTSEGRFRLHNASSSPFSVTISPLQAGDAGTYWCGSDPLWSPGNYTKIHLSVVFPQKSSSVTLLPASGRVTAASPNHPDESHSSVLVHVLPAVLILTLLSALVFVLVVIKKRKRLQGTLYTEHAEPDL